LDYSGPCPSCAFGAAYIFFHPERLTGSPAAPRGRAYSALCADSTGTERCARMTAFWGPRWMQNGMSEVAGFVKGALLGEELRWPWRLAGEA
jgi:hypothetical protein